MMDESLEKVLQECTVRIGVSNSNGTGFFAAPGLILTCAHVVKHAKANNIEIKVYWKFQDQSYKAKIIDLREELDLDIALLKLTIEKEAIPLHSCVYLENTNPQIHDTLYSFGYPRNTPDGDSATFKYEGESFKGNTPLLKLKQGQADYGLSGSPLLNLRTGGVSGIISLSRNTSTDLGGRAIPTKTILSQFEKLKEHQKQFHAQNTRWMDLLPLKSRGVIQTTIGIPPIHSERTVFMSTENVYNIKNRSSTVLHQLRAPISDFVGRKKCIAKLKMLIYENDCTSIAGLKGMGGIGKTELALHVAHELKEDFPDAQLFIDLRGTEDPPRNPLDALTECIHAFGEKSFPVNQDELIKLYRNILHGKHCLIILDNANDEKQIEPFRPPQGSSIIVTSRNQLPFKGLMLNQFSDEEGEELLLKIASRITSNVAQIICKLCGDLPLAIRAAGSLLAVTPDLKPADYAEQLRDEYTRLERIGERGVNISVEATFNLSYSLLQDETKRIFRQLALFVAPFKAESEIAIVQDTKGHEHLSELLRRSMILYDDITGLYRLHDLVRVFADKKMNKEERESIATRQAEYYTAQEKLAKEASANLYAAGNTLKVLGNDSLLANREHTIKLYKLALSAFQRVGKPEDIGDTLTAIGDWYASSHDLLTAIEYYKRAYKKAGSASANINNNDYQRSIINKLVSTYHFMGQPDRAEVIIQKHLRKEWEIYNKAVKRNSSINIFNILDIVESPQHVIRFSEDCLDHLRKYNISDSSSKIHAYINISHAYEKLGELDRARSYANRVLEMYMANASLTTEREIEKFSVWMLRLLKRLPPREQ